MAAIENLDTDVAIIGGGPAGSTTANYLAKAGINVHLFERENFPRFRIGESLLPLNMEIFNELGLVELMDQRFIRKYAALFIDKYGVRRTRFRFSESHNKKYPFAYQVERSKFDNLLIDNARQHGAHIHLGVTVNAVLFDNGKATGIRVNRDGQSMQISCRMVVDASGHRGLIGQQLGLREKSVLATRAAFFSHFENVQRPQGEHAGDIQIVPLRYGWFWIIPFKGNTTSIGVVVNDGFLREHKGDSETRLQHAIADSSYVTDLLAGARMKFPVRSIGNYSYGMKHFAGDGYVMVGDANAFLDPVFSSGVFLAMKAGQIAAHTITRCHHKNDFARSNFNHYEREMRVAQKVFLRIINGWYNPAFLDLFFTERNIFGIRKALITALAADVFNPRYLWSLKLRIELMHALAKLHAFALRRRKGRRSLIQQIPV
jgi:flavin-dependent dehydrogenase